MIYDKLGLAMIPSGYKGESDENNAGGFLGKVYSVLPAQTIGDDIVTNGTFDTDSDWSKDANWSIANGKATSTGQGRMFQSISYLESRIGTEIKVTFEITERTSGGVMVDCYGVSSGLITEVGTHTFSGITINSLNLYVNNSGQGNLVGSIDNISVQIISNGDFQFSRGSDATRVNKDGLIESVQVLSNELVQNGDFEEVGDELITNGDFSNGLTDWSVNGGSYASIVDGVLNSNNTDNGNWFAEYIGQDVVFVSGETYKVSFRARNISGAVNLRITQNANVIFTNNITSEFVEYTVYYTANADNGSLRIFCNDAIGQFEIDNVSVKEVGQNWTLTQSTISDGSLKISTTDGSFSGARQFNTFTVGKTYLISLEVSDVVGTVEVDVNSGSGYGQTFASNGTHSFYLYATNTDIEIKRAFGAEQIISATIDNISVKEVTDDTDIPRLDYSDGCPTLLLEPQRSNLFLISEPTSSDGVSASNPESYLTGDFGIGLKNGIVLGGGSSVFHYGATCQSSTVYSMSFYAKTEDGAKPVYAQSSSDANGDFMLVANGVFININTFSSLSINEVSESLYKVEATYTTGSQAGSGSNGVIQYSGNSGNLISITGFQLEQGSYPTSYIPTNGSTVTRLADVCNNAGDSTIFNDDEGVLYAEIKGLANNDAISRRITLSDGTTNQRITIELPDNAYPDNTIRVFVYSGTTVMVYDEVLNNIEDFVKIAIKYKQDDFALWVNGVELYSDTSGNTPTGLSEISFSQGDGGSLPFYGKTRSLLYFNEALTDAELEKLTSSTATQVLNNYSTLLSRVGATYESSGLETKLNELL